MATQDPGKRLEAAREAKGMALAKAWSRVDQALGPLAVSSQQIRNYELGKVPEDEWNPLVVKVLAEAYGKRVEEISEVAAQRTESVLVLLGGAGNPDEPGGDSRSGESSSDLGVSPQSCWTDSAGQTEEAA